MKILFFDMEFANGKVPGSVYSFGYVETNAGFKLLEPQTDLLINPDCVWNDYVRSHILAYPMSTVKKASLFPAHYKRICRLISKADLVVGYAVGNDTTALRKACERYELTPPVYRCLDLERLTKKLGDHPEAHGLDGCVRAWCHVEPENRHRSDGDAFATMLLFKQICEEKGVEPKEAKKIWDDCFLSSLPPKKDGEEPNKKKRFWKRFQKKKTGSAPKAEEKNGL